MLKLEISLSWEISYYILQRWTDVLEEKTRSREARRNFKPYFLEWVETKNFWAHDMKLGRTNREEILRLLFLERVETNILPLVLRTGVQVARSANKACTRLFRKESSELRMGIWAARSPKKFHSWLFMITLLLVLISFFLFLSLLLLSPFFFPCYFSLFLTQTSYKAMKDCPCLLLWYLWHGII